MLIAVALAALGLTTAAASSAAPPVAQTLNPPAPSYYTCNPVGNETICTGTAPPESWGPLDTALEGPPIVCGTGAAAFDIFDSGAEVLTARRIYDADGNLVHRVLRDDYTYGAFSNPLTGVAVPYSQSDIRTDDFAVPGDLGSATETTTWNIHFHVPGAGAPLFMNTGRTVQGPTGNIDSMSGRLDFSKLFVNGDTSVLGPLCAALSG
jgi:hypothetical protein